MKHKLAIILITAALFSPLSAIARIGESKYKCDSRYGKPTKATPVELADKAYQYARRITCHFRQGKCVLIELRTMSAKAEQELRAANGKDWIESGHWYTRDGSRIGKAVTAPTLGFMIYDARFHARLTKHRAKGKAAL